MAIPVNPEILMKQHVQKYYCRNIDRIDSRKLTLGRSRRNPGLSMLGKAPNFQDLRVFSHWTSPRAVPSPAEKLMEGYAFCRLLIPIPAAIDSLSISCMAAICPKELRILLASGLACLPTCLSVCVLAPTEQPKNTADCGANLQ